LLLFFFPKIKLSCDQYHYLLPKKVTNKYPLYYFTVMRDANLIKIMIEERALVKLIKTIGEKEYSTRDLLKKLGAYGYGHKLLIKAEDKGLVERSNVKNKTYNKLTKEGKKIIRLAKEIGV
jgi:predicted transcriptional regulator